MPSELMCSGRLLANKTILYLYLRCNFCSGLEEWRDVDSKSKLVSWAMIASLADKGRRGGLYTSTLPAKRVR